VDSNLNTHCPAANKEKATRLRPTIGLVVPSLEQGGGVPAVAEFIYQIIQDTARFNVKLISLSPSAVDDVGVGITRPQTWLRGVRVQEGVWRGRPYTRVGVLASELEFQRYRPRAALSKLLNDCDIIQVVSGAPAWANAVLGLGKPVSLQVATRARVERRRRDAAPKTLLGWWRKAMTELTNLQDNQALRKVDAIQLETPWMLDYSQKINADRAGVDIRYAPPGVDSARFYPLAQRLQTESAYILCVGRLDDPRKNICLLLNAFKLLAANLPYVQLITAGSGRPPADYWELVESMGLQNRVSHVHRPETNDLVKLYQQAAVFALSSDEEGLGVVILEAMACGVPVVATQCGGPDGIITDGVDGFLVPMDSATAMADRLTHLCTDTARNLQMGRQARTTIETRYATEVAGKAFVDVWDKLLQKVGKC
jgi:D-inositol-3-phosphate glycosyltransferase